MINIKIQHSNLKRGQNPNKNNHTNFYQMLSKNSCNIQMAEQ